MPAWKASGLAQRRDARLKEQETARRSRYGRKPKNRDRSYHQAVVYFTTLPEEDLIKAYHAVKTAFEKRKKNTP
jgi:hypothetical protein